MAKIYQIAIISILLWIFPCAGSAYVHGQQKVIDINEKIEAIAEGSILKESILGICAISGDGGTIVEIDSEKLLMPASNMKLISTGAAIHSLGPDYRYKTTIGHDGTVSNGRLLGNLYIIGGGDPTLGSKDSIATPLTEIFAEWEKMISRAGIKEIDGKVIGLSGEFFQGMAEEPTWLWNDIGTYYGTGVTGLMFHENIQSFNVSAGEQPEADINISPSYPDVPWMKFIYDCKTGKPGTGDQLYMYTSDLAPTAVIRGTFGSDRKPKRVDFSNKFPELTCAHYFEQWLNGNGITCTQGISDQRLGKESMPDSLTIIGHTESPTLKQIIYQTNHISNNLYAETLLRTLGKEFMNDGCYDSSYVATHNILKDIGIDISRGLNIQDGSGLSRKNLISTDFMCRFLSAMMNSDSFGYFIESLPSPGGPGSLLYNMKDLQPELKARIKVKSGSMDGVRCYSGYILPAGYQAGDDITEDIKKGIIIFSIMTNNSTSPTWKMRNQLDKIMELLASMP